MSGASPEWLDHVDLATSGLVIVDMQNDFCHEEGAAGLNGTDLTEHQALVPRLQNLIDAMHAAGRPVIFIRTTHDDSTNSKVWLTRRRGRTHDTCTTGTWGTEYYGVAPVAGDVEVTKHRFSAFIRTDLDLRLRALGVETLLMTGVATNGCVESTMRDGFMLDYYAILVEDCCAAATRAAHEGTIRNMSAYFGWVSTSDEIVGVLESALTRA